MIKKRNFYEMKSGLIVLTFFIFFLSGNVSAESFITTASIEGADGCTYRWFCSDWLPSACPENQIQTRKCTNAGDCPDDYQKPEEKQGCKFGLPEQLFDIKLELESDTMYSSYKLQAWVNFESFGTEPTPVNLTYVILDEFGNEIYIKKDYITVETERFITEGFTGLDLEPGEYTLMLKTLYNVNVEDKFEQDFVIEEEIKIWPIVLSTVVISLIVFLFVGLFLRWRKKAKEVKK